MVLELNPQNFGEEVTVSDKPVLIDFWAPWCPPCKMMGPVFEELSKEMKDVKFVKLNTQDHPSLAQQFDVSGIPCLILVKEGKEVDRIVGFQPKEEIKKKVEGML